MALCKFTVSFNCNPRISPLCDRRGRLTALLFSSLVLSVAVDSKSFADPTPAIDKALASCVLEPGPVGTVSRIIDAETIAVDDGSDIRLIGALAPRAFDASAKPATWPSETAATAFLSELVLGRRVRLAFGRGPRKDRYGRYLAHVYLAEAGTQHWVQGALLSAGWARAYGLPGHFDCATELIAHENDARRARKGLWAVGVYRAKPAARPQALMRSRNRFERVEGVVASVARTASGVYLNFGQDWRTDFTAHVPKEILKLHPDFAKALDQFKDARVAVRGWIERRNGPMIAITDPSQIERLDATNSPIVGSNSPPRPNASEPTRSLQPDPLKPYIDDDANKNLPDGPTETRPGGLDL
ncbi:MAG: nuclease [Hyphomicrobium sp.]|nr:MAG: nuclease [Hyphomicrobium sp.]PPD00445.1 MAG: nuclease [Hyphomicrobium sp.]